MASRILVVEDDDVQQFVLKSALEKKGYIVDVATDGLAAVRMLRSGDYDLALVDYRIPEIDGLASAKLLHEMMDKDAMPKLVAITANSSELESRAGEDGVFDAIIPKPLDLNTIANLVANELKSAPAVLGAAAADAVWRQHGLPRAPTALAIPEPTHAQKQLLQSLFHISDEHEPDVVAIVGADCADDLVQLRENSDYFYRPFIDMTGQFADIADGSITDFDPKRLAAVAKTIRMFDERWRKVTPRFQHPRDTESRLLCYLFITGQTLHPVRFAESKACVRYVGFFSTSETTRLAEQMERKGLLEKAFVDRVHVCSHCSSARLNVREECPACRSSHLHEEAVIHHFRCATQAPESAFRSGRDLVCPKCRQHLRHYGSDYDKPGTTYVCAECEHQCSDAAVGFVCFDCGTHMDGDSIPSQDIHSYRLTDAAIGLLTNDAAPRVALPATGGALPDHLTDELSRIGNGPDPTETVCVAEISYAGQDDIIARRGQSGFEKLRAIFIDNLRGALSGTTQFYSEGDRDYLLSRAALSELTQELIEGCQKTLAEPLEPRVRQIDSLDRNTADGRPAISH
jgi:CheY-like chemotaxis protein